MAPRHFDHRSGANLQLTDIYNIISPALESFPTNLPTWTDWRTVGESELGRVTDGDAATVESMDRDGARFRLENGSVDG